MRVFIFIILFSISHAYNCQSIGSFTDSRNNVTYKTITIDNITWMVENLNVVTFNNGDSIVEAKTKKEWRNARKNKIPAWCYYNNLFENSTRNGRLYNYFVISDERGITPEGWEIPTIKQFMQYESALLKVEFDNGNTLSGMRWGARAKFQGLNYFTSIWSKSITEAVNAVYCFGFGGDGGDDVDYDGYDFGCGMSIRCIKKK